MKKIITLLAACSLTLLVHAGGDKDKPCCAGKEKKQEGIMHCEYGLCHPDRCSQELRC